MGFSVLGLRLNEAVSSTCGPLSIWSSGLGWEQLRTVGPHREQSRDQGPTRFIPAGPNCVFGLLARIISSGPQGSSSYSFSHHFLCNVSLVL